MSMHLLTRGLHACALALGALPALAQVYAGGGAAPGEAIVLSNFESDAAPQLLIAAEAAPAAAAARPAGAAPQPRRLPRASPALARVIDDVAQEVGVSAALLHAVIAAESGYDAKALSPRGAIGPMQLMPATARRFGARDPLEPRDNVMAGASYLKWLMALFDNDLPLVLAAYNAGEQAVLNAGRRIPDYRETQAYVPRVLAYLRCADDPRCRPG